MSLSKPGTDKGKPATTKTCPPPSTPSMKRLPLEDLVGNVDDSRRHTPQTAVSPEEQLIWRGSQPVNTPLPRKSLKRARSSSPAAPSQDDHALDMVRTELATPQADPAKEMWSRYTSNKGTPSAGRSTAFAHLISEASPRSTAAAGSVSGLRRWASCGNEFPASHRKRRRTHGVFQDKDSNQDVFEGAPSSEGAALDQPRSNIASMVQRMRACVSRSEPRISSQLPSSSSPLPDTRDQHAESSGSPLQRRAPDAHLDTSETLKDDRNLIEDSRNPDGTSLQPFPCSSDDFGDDDFDSEMVDALEISQPPTRSFQPAHNTSYKTMPTEPAGPLPSQASKVLPTKEAGSDDDFGIDDDEDDFAADLEQVASLYDTQPAVSVHQSPLDHVEPPIPNAAPCAPIIDLVGDDSDEFGDDDIDVDDLAAAEVAATQTPANIVCRPAQLNV
jgi:DNA replication ATP-dependent helicase Dna2